MKADRIAVLDYVRSIAILMVVVCHWMQGHDVQVQWGSPLGGIANCVFFLLSGIVLGRGWDKQGRPVWGWNFVVKRIKRLYPPYVLFLVVLCAYVLISGGKLHVGHVVLNFAMLSWLAKLPAGGHLWFVTGLVFSYGCILVLTRIEFVRCRKCMGILSIGLTCLALQLCCVKLGVRQAYLPMLLLISMTGFVFSAEIIKLCEGLCGTSWAAITLGGACGGAYVLSAMVSAHIPLWAYYWICCVSAGSLIALVFVLLSSVRVVMPVRFIAGISYELYLVHNPFSGLSPGGRHLIIAFFSAWLLNRITKMVTR